MTRILGIVGGIAPESTIDYYRSLLRRYRERTGGESNPPLLINSIDIKRMIGGIAAGDLPGVIDYLSDAIAALARAGADFALLASNTPHTVFDELAARSPIPMISIVEVACAAATAMGRARLALFGTSFTMEGRFYPAVFERSGIALVPPATEERRWIHGIYMGELVNGVFLPETRERLLAIVDRLRGEEAIDGVILAGTELPLILRQSEHNGIPLLDTTAIHVEAAVDEMLRTS